jgi:4-azaleucine resistance transporter AzlC
VVVAGPQQQTATFTRAGLLAGVRAALPTGLGVAVYGAVYGLLARQAGQSFLEHVLMNVIVLAGASQTAALDLWTEPLPVVAIVSTTLLLNIRLILLGVSIRPWLQDLPARRVYPALHFLVDEGWAVAMHARRLGERDAGYLLGACLFVVVSWLGSVIAGYLIGGGVGDPAEWGLDVALTCVFAALVTSGYRSRFDLLPWGAAGLAAIVTSRLFEGTWYVLIGGIVGFIVAYAFGHPAPEAPMFEETGS